jgi:hypothetical protein
VTFRKTSIRVLAVLVVGCAWVGISAWIGRGSAGHFLLGVGPLLWFFLPLLLVLGVSLAIRALSDGRRKSIAKRVALGASGLLLLLVFQALSYPVGLWFDDADLRAAREYCDALRPRLEDWRAQRGEYPRRIGELGLDFSGAPRLFEDAGGYGSDGEHYWFHLVDPAGMLNFVGYRSERGSWEAWH